MIHIIWAIFYFTPGIFISGLFSADYIDPEVEEQNLNEIQEVGLLKEHIEPKKEMAIMSPLDERKNEKLEWLGVSFGLTQELLSFWNKTGFR